MSPQASLALVTYKDANSMYACTPQASLALVTYKDANSVYACTRLCVHACARVRIHVCVTTNRKSSSTFGFETLPSGNLAFLTAISTVLSLALASVTEN